MGTVSERRADARFWLWIEQDGKCAICRKGLRRGQGVLDHDHNTGLIRGLVHVRCNILLSNKELADCLERSKTARHGDECEVCVESKAWWRKAYIYIRTQELRQARLIRADCEMY